MLCTVHGRPLSILPASSEAGLRQPGETLQHNKKQISCWLSEPSCLTYIPLYVRQQQNEIKCRHAKMSVALKTAGGVRKCQSGH